MRWIVFGVAAGALAVTALVMRPPSEVPPAEHDVIAAVLRQFVVPLGDYPVISRASDCRTDGTTKAAIDAGLFAEFLAANRPGVEPYDLTPFAGRIRVGADGVSPRRLRVLTSTPVVSMSRVGQQHDQALLCVEVYGREERAFFVVARQRAGRWRVAAEHEAWEAPPPEVDDEEEF